MLSRLLPLAKNHNYSIDRVKFGASLDQVCGSRNEIPGPLLVLILILNKEAPFKKDVFRAPGHQASMKQLIHFLQTGRLVNYNKFSVYTIASVLKKFLRKLPGGIFGHEIEARLFEIINWSSLDEKRVEFHRLITTLPIVNQQLLVLLFGTFRAIASSSEWAATGMNSEALGVSVAPSFFQSCVSDGSKVAKMEDVQRFKVATTIVKFLIDNFGMTNLFGRENYEYYARISGRVLKIEEEWIFAFRCPFETLSLQQLSCSNEVSAPILGLDDLKTLNRYAESTKTLSYLPMVHERQTERMKTRSEWFLNSSDNDSDNPHNSCGLSSNRATSANPSSSSKGLVRRTSSKEKRNLVRRSSLKAAKDKEK
jgi:hypothetical protein